LKESYLKIKKLLKTMLYLKK